MKLNVIRIINIILIVVVAVLLLFSAKENFVLKSDEKIEKLSFTEDKVRVRLDSKIRLGLNITPNDLKNYDLEFTSSNEKIATVNSEGEITPKKSGKTKVTVTSNNGKLKDTCEIIVLKEYLFFLGDSNWELIEGKRNGGDTKKPYEINYRNYIKGKDLFFISKSGAGLSWASGSIPDYMKDNGYATRDENKNSVSTMIDQIKEHEEAYFKVIISLGTNDIKYIENKKMAEKYGEYYAEFYNELANKLPEDEIYIYSVIPIGKADSCNVYDENDYKKNEHRNTKVEAFNNSVKDNLKGNNISYVDIYSYFDFLAEKHEICFTPDGHWNKELTQKVYDKILETQSEN